MSYGHVVGKAFREAKNLPAVGRGKSAVGAFVIGVLFGPIGLGLYLRSGTDFIVPLLMIIAGSFMTAGVGAPFFWILTGVWGAWRVHLGNQPASAALTDDDDDDEDEAQELDLTEEGEACAALPSAQTHGIRRKRVSNEALT